MISQIDKKKIPLHIRTREYSSGAGSGGGGVFAGSGGGGEDEGFDIGARVLKVEIEGRIIEGDYTWQLLPSPENYVVGSATTDYEFLTAVYDNFDATTGTQKHLKIEVIGDMPNIFPNVPQQMRLCLEKYEDGVIKDTKYYWLWLNHTDFGLPKYGTGAASIMRNFGFFFDISTLEALMNFNDRLFFEVQNDDLQRAFIKSELLIDEKLIIKCTVSEGTVTTIRPFPQMLRIIHERDKQPICRFNLELDEFIDTTNNLSFDASGHGAYGGFGTFEIVGYKKGKPVQFPYKRLAVSLEYDLLSNTVLQVLSNPQSASKEGAIVIQRQESPLLNCLANTWYELDCTSFDLEEGTNVDMIVDLYIRTETPYVLFGARFNNLARSIIENSALKNYDGGIVSWLPPVIVKNQGVLQNGEIILSSDYNPSDYYTITHVRIHAGIHGVMERCYGCLEVTFSPHFQVMAWSVARINYFNNRN